MSWWQALLLGLIQGLTEFLPVSSSGHLELGKALLNVEISENLLFTVVVHIATVLSTIVVFRKEIGRLFAGFFSKGKNDDKSFVWKLLLSAVPVALVGFLFKDYVDVLFDGRILLVGCMLLVTAAFLAVSYFVRKGDREIGWLDALIIGVGQAVAVMPGLSRSGTTIATGMMLGNKPSGLAKFSFLMVIIPVLGEMFLDLIKGDIFAAAGSIGAIPLSVGFLAAFLSGLFACRWMIKLVSKGKLIWFAVYCVVIGIIAIICGL